MNITKKLGAYLFTFVFAFTVLFTGAISQSVANADSVTSFKDVSKHWAKESIDWAVEKDMIKGYSDGTFRPDTKVTEAEFLTMLLRLYDSKIEGEKQTHWADPYYDFASGYNYILPGHSNIKSRDKIVNRTQVAELVSATEGVNLKGDDAIKYLLVFNLAKGKGGEASIESYHGKDNLTRAEAVQFVRNVSEYGLGALIVKQTDPTDPSEIPEINFLLSEQTIRINGEVE
jgi:hypothetical protein